jgi:hypothetical protein
MRDGASEPVARARCDHFTTADTLTENRSATARQVAPRAKAAKTRRRKSKEYGLAMHAGLQPSMQPESEFESQGNPNSDSA